MLSLTGCYFVFFFGHEEQRISWLLQRLIVVSEYIVVRQSQANICFMATGDDGLPFVGAAVKSGIL